MEAAVYFRRILAFGLKETFLFPICFLYIYSTNKSFVFCTFTVSSKDRHPPLDAIYENGTVVPRLIQFLSFADNAPLQLEAAWSLTNFACGEAIHVKHLIDNGAVPELFKVPTKDYTL